MFLRMILLVSLPLVAFYVYNKLRYCRLEQFAAWPQLEKSTVWGHLKALHEFIIAREPKRHIGGLVFPVCLVLLETEY